MYLNNEIEKIVRWSNTQERFFFLDLPLTLVSEYCRV